MCAKSVPMLLSDTNPSFLVWFIIQVAIFVLKTLSVEILVSPLYMHLKAE
jgi:hypothetical protein